jgi:hypothetical protein
MKTILTIFLLTVSVMSAQAVVRIVDNNGNRPAGNNIYATFALAESAASIGDTLLITPSTASYGSVNISKSITVLGIGFNPDKSSLIKSNFTSITIYNAISNVNISGVVVGQINLGQNNSANTISNILIEKCQINGISAGGSTGVTLSNILIRQNLFKNLFNSYAINMSAATQSGVLISNNIFTAEVAATNAYGITTSTGGFIIDQNLFMGPANSNASLITAFGNLVNSQITNNIFYGMHPRVASIVTVTYNNNRSFGNSADASFPVGVDAITNKVEDPQFESGSTPSLYDFTKDMRLKSGSPALTASQTSGQIGIYGGSTPYKNSGVSLPVVKTLTLPSAIQQGTNTSATISVNGN